MDQSRRLGRRRAARRAAQQRAPRPRHEARGLERLAARLADLYSGAAEELLTVAARWTRGLESAWPAFGRAACLAGVIAVIASVAAASGARGSDASGSLVCVSFTSAT